MEVLNKIAQLKAELDSLRPLDKDREAATMQKLRLDWNYHSNHLEGNSLTFGETKALILFGITAAGKPLKDHFEMTGHDEAVKWVEDVVKEGRPLTEAFIRELHKLILKEPSIKKTKTPEGLPGTRVITVGAYKTVPNHVETVTGEMFYFATPEETPAKMHDLLEWYRKEESDPEKHPLLLAAEFHHKFILIHPFDDGNGRTVRILMNFILMKHGYPPVVVKTEDKANYIAALQQSDAGIISPFIEYIGQNLAHSLEIMLRGARGENIDEADDVDKEIALIKQKIKSTEKYFKSPTTVKFSFENSIKPLLFEYVKVNKKFYNLYKTCGIAFNIKGEKVIINFDEEDLVRLVEANILTHIDSVFIIDLLFSSLNGEGFENINYSTYLSIEFEKNSYRMDGNAFHKILVKNYDERISDFEIQKIVRSETKAHTNFINQQIENAQQP